MPRSTPDIDVALKAAKEVFWRRGYDDASIEDVVKATGFNRYAIYNAYGGKLELFLAVLDAYYYERKNAFLDSLNNAQTAPLEAVREVFEVSIAEMAERGSGCLICNVATEVGRQEAVVSERINDYLQQMTFAYAAALHMAAERGELSSVITPEEGANLLITLKLGLGVRSRNGAAEEEMRRIVDAVLSVIKAPQKM